MRKSIYRKSKKALALVLCVAMLMSFTCIAAAADETTLDLSEETTFTWDGESVTVVEGNDTKYEVLAYNDSDEDTDADATENSDGSVTYTVPSDFDGELDVEIKKAGGSYVFEGDGVGTIRVKKEATGDAVIYLNGITLTSNFTAPIVVKKDSTATCTIYAVEGTENNFSDVLYNWVDEDDEADGSYVDNLGGEDAVMKFKDSSDVTITGGGTINIDSNAKDGIKANGALTITGNVTINIDCENHTAIKSNAEEGLYITSGTFNITDENDGIHADYALVMGTEGGDDSDLIVNITSNNEGIEGASVDIYSGTYTLYTADDSINAANSDLTDYSYYINIAGGTIYAASAQNDCVDSNGSLTISGGTIVALGAIDPSSDSDDAMGANSSNADGNAFDCEGTFTISGGTVFGAGQADMAPSPSSDSQTYVVWTSEGSSTAGSNTGTDGYFNFGNMSFSTVGATLADATSADGPSDGSFGGDSNSFNGGSNNGWDSNNNNNDFNNNGGGFVYNNQKVIIYDADGNEVFSVNTSWNTTSSNSANYVIYSAADIVSGSSYTLSLTEADSDSDTSTDTTADTTTDTSTDTTSDDTSTDSDTDSDMTPPEWNTDTDMTPPEWSTDTSDDTDTTTDSDTSEDTDTATGSDTSEDTDATTDSDTSEDTDTGLLMDVNLDGKVSLKDATLIQMYIAELREFNSTQIARADANQDGSINSIDVLYIMMYLAYTV